MLTVSNVTKRYHKVVANDNISFELPDGQVGILLGPNGAGKSTIIKCIMGFLKYEGMITIDGLANKSLSAKKIMGYIPEIPSLYPNLTVDEHMEFIARAKMSFWNALIWRIRKRNLGMNFQKVCSRS